MLPDDIQVLERGWLSANTVLLRGDARGPVIVDTGYCSHASQTLVLIAGALGEELPREILNTHLHSDHCGGNAALQQRYSSPIRIPPGQFWAAKDWDESALSYRATGQECPRFIPTAALTPGEVYQQSGREWQIHAAPGHDPDAVLMFDPKSGVLIAGDALWEHGFGIVFPELDGEHAFEAVAASLDLIEALQPAVVIPGHGAPFSGLALALAEARSRLSFFKQQPERHAQHAAKALVMFHMLEHRRQPRDTLQHWQMSTPVHQAMWKRFFAPAQSLASWSEQVVEQLLAGGQLKAEGEVIRIAA
ncbi:MBL fold metallo-hydrolase [Paucibacter sp. APW11]|uniref:beta-lactamase n=1 Tax=Roseateles aquae TaxID=3077235 RepID=A0ABU3PIF7_9BURK|nr:MBL fold metallo-hydrolase [Paucibacter sp. APW11]MDT9002346.1 MBL fold metallo-hydrolase [Paucibacter sp. APW11]